MSYNLRYRKSKIKTKNFIPIIQYSVKEIIEENTQPPQESHPLINSFYSLRSEPPIEDYEENKEDEEEDTSILLELFITRLKKIKGVRQLELWISKNKKKIKELTQKDIDELLFFINNKYYNNK